MPLAMNMRRWDLMRFLWRGKLRAHVRDVDFSLGTAIDPEVTAASRRLQVLLRVTQVKKRLSRVYLGQLASCEADVDACRCLACLSASG